MAERNLRTLLESINPVLDVRKYVFCSVAEDSQRQFDGKYICLFKEEEGITLILEKEIADFYKLPYSGAWARITCLVKSDLEAIGFLAAITNRLSKADIPVNPVSAYFHDHLFVPEDKAAHAVRLLKSPWEADLS
jgi:hypothetical protein